MLDVDSTRDQKDQVLQRLAMAHFKLAEAARLLGQWQAPTAYRMARCGDEGAGEGLRAGAHCIQNGKVWIMWA